MDPRGLAWWDRTYGLPKRFWDWYHRSVKRKGDPDVPSKEDADELAKQWEKEGKPGGDKKRNRRKDEGFADPEIFEWIVPWWATPSALACSDMDCNNNGVPDFAESTNGTCPVQ